VVLSSEDRLDHLNPATASLGKRKYIPLLTSELLNQWGLLKVDYVRVFEEATRTIAQQLKPSICLLGIIAGEHYYLQSEVGLSQLEAQPALSEDRRLLLHALPCCPVVHLGKSLVLENLAIKSEFIEHPWVQQSEIQAYLGMPLLTSAGQCIGVLEILDFQPRTFTSPEIALMEMVARWCMGELERQQLSQENVSLQTHAKKTAQIPQLAKFELLTQLSQELCAPLTPLVGMTSVLLEEIYGSLTPKQREYLNVIYKSSQTMLAFVNEITDLSRIDEGDTALHLTVVNIEMLCQQTINHLTQKAQQREQQLRLTIEPESRIWQLDRERIRQLLYHLIGGVTQAASSGSTICIHVTRNGSNLRISVWATHPWLSDGLRQADLIVQHLAAIQAASGARSAHQMANQSIETALLPDKSPSTGLRTWSQEALKIALSRRLAALQGGKLILQGSAESGYRFVVSIPSSASTAEMG
jgi:signal transduction histidine kinase